MLILRIVVGMTNDLRDTDALFGSFIGVLVVFSGDNGVPVGGVVGTMGLKWLE